MKLHAYLEQLLGTKAGISILRSLVKYKGRTFTVRGLGKDSGVSNVESSRTIKQLEQFGIVKIQPVGRAYQLFLNDQSYVLDKIVKPILMAEEMTVSTLTTILAKHLATKKIISAVIFGSVAKREEKEDSDIDLLVISDDFDHAAEVVANANEDIALVFHTRISPIIFAKKEFLSKKKNDLIRSILSNHILVTGSELEKLK
ncbi:MAG: nucleotidyltransferase domain-containing protein [Candidatus Nitrosotalea sp.]|nr:nucleotidyltransferase domain-containing protein [Candidatus Nitrosotalea sp.]